MLLFHFHVRLCKTEQFNFHLSPLDLTVMFWILEESVDSQYNSKAMVRQYFPRNFPAIDAGYFIF